MKFRLHGIPAICLLAVSLLACSRSWHTSGNPDAIRPEEVKSFDILYAQNCSGCHGKDGQDGPATVLANPEYQALIDDGTLRKITAQGQEGTLMPGFAKASGGPLTDEQIEVMVTGMRQRWRRSGAVNGLPSYLAQGKPNPEHGRDVYAASCASCHGPTADRPGSAGSVLDGTFLGLISDQVLRTTIIAGRPDLGMPDWRNQGTGKPLTDPDITDVVAWMSSQRRRTLGQPYPSPQTTTTAKPQEPQKGH